MPVRDERLIFETARTISEPHERRAYLAQTCDQDDRLQARVEALLRAHERNGAFLDSPAVSVSPPDHNVQEKAGDQIGPFKLVGQIGEGGFGIVFRAERTESIRRVVALKILKPGMDTREVVARFEAERQVLAMMEHPNIARVFNAGATPTGRPYFVMELITGLPITRFCDEQRLGLRERLNLFIEVCRAVQHAHQKGIIHRDLKPNNVLVAVCDGTPVPKIIDFGVAKALGERLTERTFVTAFGGIIGTLEYMSPEQAEFNARDIDTRADIYSLGVLLYELLTGTTPATRDRLKQAATSEALRMIREEEPPKPSTRLSESGRTPEPTSEQRRLELEKLSRTLRGDLDWIVMKALEKDRDRRYETANGFAMDVERYLADEPVLARPPSAAYRLRKFVRRNQRGLAAAALLGVMLLAVVGTLGWAVRDRAVRAEEAARDRQTRRAMIQERVTLALEEANTRYQEGRWKESLDAAKRAEALAATGEGDDETRRRARQVLGDMQMLAKLEEVRVQSTHNELGFDLAAEDSGNAEAFREYGIDIDVLEPDDAVRRIQARPIRYELAILLDSWSYVRRRLEARGKRPVGRDWKELLEIARAVDSDPWRDRFRNAVLNDDRKALVELAASVPVSSLRAETVDRLGNALMVMGAIQEAVDFLKKGQGHYPQDYWINANLALCLRRLHPPQTDAAIRYFTATVALRPEVAWSQYDLGVALADNREIDAALDRLARAAVLWERRKTASSLYHGARCRALIAATLAARAKNDPAWNDRAQQEAKRSVSLLERAIRAGYHNFTEISHDKNLHALRDREEFKRLLPSLNVGAATERLAPWQDPPAPAQASDYVRLSQWDKAAAEFAKAEWSGPIRDDAFVYACLLLLQGDTDGYHRFCQNMIQRVGETKDAWEAYVLARSCAMARESTVDPARAIQWAEQTVASDGHPWNLHVLGLAQYRAGELGQALQSFNKSNVDTWNYKELNWFGLALVHHDLGHAVEARQYLDKGIQWLNLQSPPSPEQGAKLLPADWIEAQLLRREAEELLNENRNQR